MLLPMISKLEQRLHTKWTKYYKQAVFYSHLTLSLKFDKVKSLRKCKRIIGFCFEFLELKHILSEWILLLNR